MAGYYKKLIHNDDLGKVTLAFEEAIALSFVTNPMNKNTQLEIKRRFDLCDKLFTLLRGDLKWSIPKICDALPTYLKCELDNVPYTPESVRQSWSPQALEQIHDVPRLPKVYNINDRQGSELSATEDLEFSDLEKDLGVTD